MKDIASTLALALALTLGAHAARAQCPDAFGPTTIVDIKGKHYDATGVETKVKCSTRQGDSIQFTSCFTCSSPPTRSISVYASTPECQKLHQLSVIIGETENQIVKNGNPKNACLFHGTVLEGSGGLLNPGDFPYIQAIKRFNSAGVAKSEKGVFSYSTAAGEMFVGKIKVRYQ